MCVADVSAKGRTALIEPLALRTLCGEVSLRLQ
jgi:hypothetical protein